MKRKVLSITLTVIMALSSAIPALAEDKTAGKDFVTISFAYPEGTKIFTEDYQTYSRLILRYADDKTVIPMSALRDDTFYAVVPAENAERTVEAYVMPEAKFTDDDDSFEIYIMEQAAEHGIVNGDDEGRALPFADVTRAEATAMAMRLLGVSKSDAADPGFDDVKKDDWFYGDVANAKAYGIVQGDDEKTFAPERNVSNEELVTMIARTIAATGYQDIKKDVTDDEVNGYLNIADADKISDWARGSYALLKNAAPYFNVETDIPEDSPEGGYVVNYYYNPQESAKRYQTARCADDAAAMYITYPTKTAIEYGFDKKMPVIDGSTSTYPFTEAVYGNLFLNGYSHKDKPQKHSKSHASYERLINGEVDMLFASVYPASDILELAKEKGVELELVPIAYDAMIFFTNADNPATGLTSEQISKIYVDNAYENWKDIGGPDALLYPYCRNNDSGSHAQMERHFLNGKEINEKIRNETTSISMSNVLTDVVGAETKDPAGYALGYSIYYYFKNMDMFYDTSKTLKLLSVDGVEPNDKTIADGSYPLSNNTYIVLRKDTPEDAPARKMAKFMLTPLGQKCVKEAGFGPLKADNITPFM